MKRYSLFILLLLIFVVVVSCSLDSTLKLEKVTVNVVENAGWVSISRDGRTFKYKPTELQYIFVVRNVSDKEISGAEIQTIIEYDTEFIATFNKLKSSGTRFGRLAPDQTDSIYDAYSLGSVDSINLTYTPPTAEEVEKIKADALNATLIIKDGPVDLLRVDLKKFQ